MWLISFDSCNIEEHHVKEYTNASLKLETSLNTLILIRFVLIISYFRVDYNSNMDATAVFRFHDATIF